MSNVLDNTTMTEERQKVLDLHQAGWSVREMAEALGLSTQRIYQQLKRLRELGQIPEKETA